MDMSFIWEAFAPFAKLLIIVLGVVFMGILLDYLTGTIAARHNGEWSSKKAREGITHKMGILLAILLGVVLDVAVIAAKEVLGWTFPYIGLFTPLIALSYAVTEIGSIIENLQKMGVYVPPILIKGFEMLHHTVDQHVEEVPEIPAEIVEADDENDD